MSATSVVSVKLTGNASDMLSMFSTVAESGDQTAASISGTFSDAAAKMGAAMSDASDKIRASLAEVASGDLSAQELQDKFTELAGTIDGSISDAMATFSREVEEGTAKATESVGAFRDKYASAMLQLDAANKEAGVGLGSGLKTAEKDAEDDASGFSGRMAGIFSKVGKTLASWGLPFGESVSKMGEKIKEAESEGKGFKASIQALGKTATVVGAVGIAAVASESVDLANKQAQAATSLAASAGISVKAATSIGNAFEGTAFKSVYSDTEMTKAYAGVAAQLATVNGKALNTKEALTFMSAASDLAEGSGTDLGTATSSLATVMQSYGINATGAANASDILFNTSTKTGVGLGQVTSSLQRLHTQLGANAPSLADTSGLMLDMTEHGETGRAALMAMSTTMTALLKPTQQNNAAIQEQNKLMASMPDSLRPLAQAYLNGTMTTKEFTARTSALSMSQQGLMTQFEASVKKVQTTGDAVSQMGIKVTNANGTFVGMQSIIAQLQPKLAGMSGAQATAALTTMGFGSASAKLAAIIQAGPAAYAQATAAVSKMGSAHEAAEKQSQTLQHQLETLKAGLEDEGVKIGQMLIPKLEDLVRWTSSVVTWFTQHKTVAAALAGVIGGALTAAIGVYVAGLISAAADSVMSFGTMVAGWLGLSTAAEAAAPALDAAAAGLVETDVAADANPIGAIVLVLVALGAAAYELYEHWTTVWDFIKKYSLEVAAAVTVALLPILGPIALIGGAAILLATHWKEVWHEITDIWNGIKTDTIDTWNSIEDFFKKWWPEILGVFTGGILLLPALIIQNWNKIENFTKQVWNTILNFFKQMWQAIVSTVSSGINQVVNFFESLPGRAYNAVSSLVGKMLSFGSAVVSAILWGIGEVEQGLWDWFIGLPEMALHYAEGALGDLFSLGQQMVHEVISGIESIGSSIGGAIEGFIGIGGKSGTVQPTLPVGGKNALGGLYTTPTWGLFGEAGPEVILPLNNPTRMGQIMQQAQPYMSPGASQALSGTGGASPTNHFAPTINVYQPINPQQLAQELAYQAKYGALVG